MNMKVISLWFSYTDIWKSILWRWPNTYDIQVGRWRGRQGWRDEPPGFKVMIIFMTILILMIMISIVSIVVKP